MKKTLKVNIYDTYIVIVITILLFGLISSMLRSFTGLVLVRYVLFLSLINNIWFIILNLNKIKLKLWSSVLFAFTIISLVIGILNNPISTRTILDFLKPVTFILVYEIFANAPISTRDRILHKLKNSYSKILFRISVFFSILSIILLTLINAYPGLRPPVVIPLTVAFLSRKNINGILLLILTFFVGKRALILTNLPVIIRSIRDQISFKKLLMFFSLTIISLIIISSFFSDVFHSKAMNKYNYTIDKIEEFNETGDLEILNVATGKRIQEITSGFYNFSTVDYILGKGVGYTYDLYNIDRTKLYNENYGNIHFSPGSLAMSYGLMFLIVFYFSYIRILVSAKRLIKETNSFNVKLLYFVALSYFFESFFAFVFFTLTFIPIILGLLTNYIQDFKNEIVK